MQTTRSIGKNLIFLISQPRAGSTLTQKILGSHSDVFTTSEPWILLHPLSTFRSQSYTADYGAQLAQEGSKDFLAALPGGEKEYLQRLALLHEDIYLEIAEKHGKKYFLDKTPRYYHIIPELAEFFGAAHFIILLRNPLAVFCSILNTWIKEEWLTLRYYQSDIFRAPQLLLEGIRLLGDRAIVMHYETVLKNPHHALKDACQKIGIAFTAEMLSYGQTDAKKWLMGDQENVYQNSKPNPDQANQWTKNLASPQVWRLASDYLEILGADTLAALGYDYNEMRQCLEKHAPGRASLWKTMPLEWLMKEPTKFGTWNYGFYPVRLMYALQQGTALEGSATLMKRLTSRLRNSSYLDSQ